MNIHRLRNIGISAHIDSGKTTLTERMLFYCGRIHRIREVRGGDGGATMDFDELEKLHGITISSAVTHVEWNDHDINIIDTPGHVDFTIEVERSLRVLDGAVFVLCSVGGVQSQSLTVDRQMKRYGVPRIAFINKMDRPGADPDTVIRQMNEKLNANAVMLQLPIGTDDQFDGVINLVTMDAVYFSGDKGEVVERRAIPAEMTGVASAARERMLDQLSQFDDLLTECLIAEEEPDRKLVGRVIREATIAHQITPVLMGTAYKNKGVQELLDAVTMYLPSPADRKVYANDLTQTDDRHEPTQIELSADNDQPMVAMAFKTIVESFGQLTFMRIYQGRIEKGATYVNARTKRKARFSRLVRVHAGQREDIDVAWAGDIIGVVGVDCASGATFLGDGIRCSLENIFVPQPVIRLAIEPVDRQDADKLAKALGRFRREDPTFRVSTDQQTGETFIAGMGQLHLSVYMEKLQRDHKCKCVTGPPKVAWKQRPTQPVAFNHKLNKRSGGPGLYAHIVGRMEPLPVDADESFVFINEVTGGRIPQEFIGAVKQGFENELNCGPLGGFEVVGVKVTLCDGSFHEVDSSDLSFRTCASEAMRSEILPRAGMVLLEPVMKLDVEVPGQFQGTITGHIAQMRGTVTSSVNSQALCVISAEVPLVELFNYANDSRSMTQGEGTFTMEFLCYRKTSRRVQD